MAKKSPLPQELVDLALAKMESSGLSTADMNALKIDVLTADQTRALHPSFKHVPSLRINYMDPRTGTDQSCLPKWPAFYRLRYLKTPTDVASLAQKKPQRYAQLPNSGVCAYFPAIIPNWPELLSDPKFPLIITEGELKAACACKRGYPTIGIGGVFNWQSAKLGLLLLEELEAVNWRQRNVYLIFDSDFRTNPNVCHATNALAEQLRLRGAFPFFVALPDVVENGKTGLDDYLVAEKDPEALARLLHEKAEPLTIARPLWQMNEQVLYVYDPGLVLVKETGQKLAPANFKQHAFSDQQCCELTLRDDGTVSMKGVCTAEKWLSWSFRATTGRITYKPGQERELLNGSVRTSEWNVWPGWGCTPKKGDTKLFHQLLDHLFTGAEKEAKKWFLQWLAYPLQHPGAKLFTCAVLHGRFHGTGKSFIGYTLGRIYGKNFSEIKQEDLHGNFTEWCENKQFILADDITGTDKRKEADKLKSMITQKDVRINIKYVPSYSVPDCINYLFTSNQPDAFFLEDDDRRFFIHEVKVSPLDDAFYRAYDSALYHDPEDRFARVVFDELMRMDLSDFNPAARAYSTAAKQRMIADVKSDLGAWVSHLIIEPDAVLKVGQAEVVGDLFSNRELLDLYDPSGRTGCTANGLGRELRRSGVALFRDGAPLKTTRGQDRYYIVRNLEKWLKAGAQAGVKHLEERYQSHARHA